jgi:hypothetical protein
MTFAARGNAAAPLDIDMDRVVADAEYRRRVITRLRQERLLAEAQKAKDTDPLDLAAGEDD